MKKRIIIMTIVALMGLWIPTYAMAEDSGTHGADVSSDEWEGGDVDLNFDLTGDFSGVEEIQESAPTFKVAMENGEIVVFSSVNSILPVYSLNGTVAAIARIQEGRNVIEIQSSGIYVIGGKKIAL